MKENFSDNPEIVSSTQSIEGKTRANESLQEKSFDSEADFSPQVIVEKERGFAHYVGFALLTLLSIIFFFMPGISIAYLIDKVTSLEENPILVWILSAIVSALVWLVFKMKIKGFKRASVFYIIFCGILFFLWLLISQMGNVQAFTQFAKLLLP